MRLVLPFLALLTAVPAAGETLVAARTLPALAVLTPADLALVAGETPGAATDPGAVVGLETRVAIYQGRPIRMADLGAPAIVERNQDVTLIYRSGPLVIGLEGRALGRGGAGDRIKVQNIASRTVLSGVVAADGTVLVTAGN